MDRKGSDRPFTPSRTPIRGALPSPRGRRGDGRRRLSRGRPGRRRDLDDEPAGVIDGEDACRRRIPCAISTRTRRADRRSTGRRYSSIVDRAGRSRPPRTGAAASRAAPSSTSSRATARPASSASPVTAIGTGPAARCRRAGPARPPPRGSAPTPTTSAARASPGGSLRRRPRRGRRPPWRPPRRGRSATSARPPPRPSAPAASAAASATAVGTRWRSLGARGAGEARSSRGAPPHAGRPRSRPSRPRPAVCSSATTTSPSGAPWRAASAA